MLDLIYALDNPSLWLLVGSRGQEQGGRVSGSSKKLLARIWWGEWVMEDKVVRLRKHPGWMVFLVWFRAREVPREKPRVSPYRNGGLLRGKEVFWQALEKSEMPGRITGH